MSCRKAGSGKHHHQQAVFVRADNRRAQAKLLISACGGQRTDTAVSSLCRAALKVGRADAVRASGFSSAASKLRTCGMTASGAEAIPFTLELVYLVAHELGERPCGQIGRAHV